MPQLETMWNSKNKGKRLGVKPKWYEEGENIMESFLNLEKRNHVNKNLWEK